MEPDSRQRQMNSSMRVSGWVSVRSLESIQENVKFHGCQTTPSRYASKLELSEYLNYKNLNYF